MHPVVTDAASQHPSLHAVLQQVRGDGEIWLPYLIQSGRSSWLWRGIQYVDALGVWVQLLVVLCMVMSLVHAWWLLVALGIATVVLMRRRAWRNPAHDHGLPLEWNGWRIHVPQRTLVRTGHVPDEAAQHIDALHLEPADAWSVGVLMGDARPNPQTPYAWHLELRHRSRGPVAVLCVVHSHAGARAVLQNVDALADALALRLGIRRSGSRLVRSKRRQ